MSLTDLSIKSLKPSEGQIVYWDKGLKSFGLRISPGGTMTWTLLVGKERQRIKIGNYPIVSLAKARDAAKRILAERTLGQHKPRSVPFSEALDEFETSHCAKLRPKTAYETKRLLKKHFQPTLKSKTLEKIAASDITRVTDNLSPSVSSHAATAIGTFFNWAVGRQYLQSSPVAGLRKAPKSPPRERLLSDFEVKSIWPVADELGFPYGSVLNLALTTGQRRGQIAALRWSWINEKERTISFPASVMKAKRPHVIPYSDLTASILERLPNTGDLLFPARGKKHKSFNGWSKNAAALRKKLGDVEPFVIHDFRRYLASTMAALGISIATIEKFLAHHSGTFAGIVQVYQRHSWLPEMREAVDRYEKHLQTTLAR